MYRRTIKSLALLITTFLLVAMSQASTANGQGLLHQRQQRTPRPRPAPQPSVPLPPQTSEPAQDPFRLDRGGKVSITNTMGQIAITGSDRDTVEATGRVDDRVEPIRIRIRGDSRSAIISVPVELRRHGGEVYLDVKVPRYAEIESAETRHGDVVVTDVDGAVFISAVHGDVSASRIGTLRIETRNGDLNVRTVKNSLVVRSLNGDVDVADVGGQVEISATSGDLNIQNVGSNLRAASASGDITVRCVKGRADINTASGSLTMSGVSGDVEANTASGSVVFRGPIRQNGRYSLKSLSGEVEMFIQPDPPGFTATLTTYSGEIETQFELKINSPLHGPINRRVTG
ncbi:MAG TPA: DUF4097 family beta strand repeat-containing protein, partial [Blastocatellia bacterium]|nr:DUF4097 family beta strand repeat-containing protein [Blastocatellia bacterium]